MSLSHEEIEEVITLLRQDGRLPDEYRNRLFATNREALLSYADKEPAGSVLATTMGVPLQVTRSFGESGEGSDDWSNSLIFGDNLQVLKRLLDLKRAGALKNADGSDGIRVCYIDPPFATKREFKGKRGQLAYRDRVSDAGFIEFLRKRLIFIHELLADDGALYMHLDTKKVHYMKVLLDEIFGAQNFRSEIIWKRSSAHNDTSQGVAQHGRIHDTILFYTKSDKWVWNPVYTTYDDAYLASEYRHIDTDGRRYKQTDLTGAKPGGDSSFEWRVMRQVSEGKWQADLKDSYKRPRKGWEYKAVRPYKGRYWAYSRANLVEFDSQGKLHYRSTGMPRLKQFADEMPGVSLQDLWTDVNALGASAVEREDYPTQKPLQLVERILQSSSSPGDIVLDCFAGSGTTLVAAERLARRWVGIDSGKLAIYTAQQRLLGLPEGLSRFELCNAGLYENHLVEDLPLEKFTQFALDLFGCVSDRFEIAGVQMMGTRNGAPVHVFPFESTDAVLAEEYIASLHERIGHLVSGPVYLIVPASKCDMFGDVLSLDSANYFVLQIPYSVIESLHQRPFALVPQPTSEDEINDAVGSYGFDFAEPIEADLSATFADDGLSLVIESFRRGGLHPDHDPEDGESGRSDLALLLMDTDFDGQNFSVAEYWFGQDLEQAAWSLKTTVPQWSSVAIVLIDTHGNESRRFLRGGTQLVEGE